VAPRSTAAGVLLAAAALLLSCAGTDPKLPADASDAEVIGMLGDENPARRAAAADELGSRRVCAALEPLLDRLRDAHPAVRAHAAEALRRMGDERAVAPLARALRDASPLVRCRAAIALGDLGGPSLAPSLEALLSDPEVVVRAAAVRALGELGDPRSLDAVLDALIREEEDRSAALAGAALIAAARLGGPDGLARGFGAAERAFPRSWFLRSAAARAIAVAGDRDRIGWLAARLAEDPDARVAQAAAAALMALGERETLRAGLEDPTAFRRRAAVAALADGGGEEVEPVLAAATADEDGGVRLEAATALLERGRAEAFGVLIALLSDDSRLGGFSDSWVWLGALDALESRSGERFGRDPERWRRWFRERRERLVFRPEEGVYGVAR